MHQENEENVSLGIPLRNNNCDGAMRSTMR